MASRPAGSEQTLRDERALERSDGRLPRVGVGDVDIAGAPVGVNMRYSALHRDLATRVERQNPRKKMRVQRWAIPGVIASPHTRLLGMASINTSAEAGAAEMPNPITTVSRRRRTGRSVFVQSRKQPRPPRRDTAPALLLPRRSAHRGERGERYDAPEPIRRGF